MGPNGKGSNPPSTLFSRGLDDSDSGSNDDDDDTSLTGRSPLYGNSGYLDTSSDLDMHSERSYGKAAYVIFVD